MILARSLRSIQEGLSDTARLERQIVTGERYGSLSEAPVTGRAVLTIDADLRASEQYTRNIASARSRLNTEDDALDSVNRILTRAREIAIQQGSDVSTPETRAAGELEVAELRASVIQIANTQLNDAYVFGGGFSDRAPLDSAGALDPAFPARGAPQYEIAASTFAFAAHDAGQIFIDTGVMTVLDDLETALAADDRTGIQTAANDLTTVIGSFQQLVAEVGARQNRLDTTEAALTVIDLGRHEQRATLMDTPIEEAITQLASRQASYQASLLATSRLLDTSLVNYLR